MISFILHTYNASVVGSLSESCRSSESSTTPPTTSKALMSG